MNETSITGPLPSKHVFLHELGKLPGGSKVRFLCCVVDYKVSTGALLVEHAFPHVLPIPRASIDVRLVLESIKAHELQRGSWLNVIGYVRKVEQRHKKTTGSTREDIKTVVVPTVQAIIVWDAGAIKVADYEAALIIHRETRMAAGSPTAH